MTTTTTATTPATATTPDASRTTPAAAPNVQGLMEAQVIEAEGQLRKAMLESDIDTLDALLNPGLMFTNHVGEVFSKQDDLTVHRSGVFEITKISVFDQKVEVTANVGVVSSLIRLVGRYDNQHSDNRLRLTRVWVRSPMGRWQVVAGHSSLISD